MSIFPSDPSRVGPLSAISGQIVSGPSDVRQAGFWVSIRGHGDAVYRRVTDAAGASTESSRAELLTEIAARLARRSRVLVVLVVGALACVVGATVSIRVSALIAIAAIVVLYSLSDGIAPIYKGILNGVAWIGRSESRSSSRGVVNIQKATGPLTTNVAAPELSLGPMRLQFLPDGILVLHTTAVWFVPYSQVKLETSRARYLHRVGIPPADSPRVGQQWTYQRKDGTPDRRRKFNPLLPLVETGQLKIFSEGVLSEALSFSNPAAAEHFRDAIVAIANPKPIAQTPSTAKATSPSASNSFAPASTLVKAPVPGMTATLRDELVRAVIRAEGVPRLEKPVGMPRRQTPADGNTLWVPASRQVTVHGFNIGGFVYLGEHLRGLDVHFAEPSLIDPSKAVDRSNIASASDMQIGYSLSYDRLTPKLRTAFLGWLANGRRDPDAPIGFVFLFFYGLERRVFEYLGGKGSDAAECIAIAREVERLLSIYSHESFGWYASSLLDLLSAREPELIAPSRGDRSRPGDALPFRTRIALGKLASAGAILPADLALQWLRVGGRALRTPATRCPEQFERLFAIRYAEAFEGGMRLRANKTAVTVRYTPASGALRERSIKIDSLPDVTALTKPLAEFERIADGCCNELDPYSRWIAKNPQSAQSLGAISILPPALVPTIETGDVGALTSFLKERLGSAEYVVIGADEFLFYWIVANPLKISKGEAVQLAQALDRLGFSIEPDVRFGGPPPTSGGAMVIFRRSADATTAPPPEYTAALVLARLGVIVAKADGVFTADERNTLHRAVADAFDLPEAERRRLDAHVEWLTTTNLGTLGLKKQLASLVLEQRARVGACVVRIAAADGVVDAAEMRTLEKLYKSLDLTADDLYRNMHSAMVDTTDAARAPQIRPNSVTLDMGRVQSKLAETATVSSLLADLFADEADPVAVSIVTEASDTPAIGKLDAAQSAFLHALIARGEWPRCDVELLASTHALLVDGALEAINDYAFERCGDPVWEGDDPLIINDYVAKEILT
jgi:tellurite resistance protein